ncbi:MAG TPA: amidase family protein [Solirubrobacteraceae bacterium]|nr:amidase family protein [Solirubrobacteraceae bacterium]
MLAALALLLALTMLCGAASAAASTLDLETLTGAQAEKMLRSGEITSVELVKLYLARIAAINKSGPGINAVTQLNPEAMKEAKAADKRLARHEYLGPADGVPILLKDIIDATPMYTTAGDWALRESFPEKDSGVAKELRAHGVVILGKAGLSEWANSFGSQPSGFGNVTGQVLNANDAAQGPSGSSSGSGAAAAAGLAALTIGTETSGSIISPSTAENDVGMRPTLGLVPGYGIAPIDASQDTAGPIVKTVEDAAITLQSIAEVPGADPEENEEYYAIMGPDFWKNGDLIPAPFTKLPEYTSALRMNYVKGKRIGYNGNTCTPSPCTPTPQQEAVQRAVTALEKAGAIMVPDEPTKDATLPSLPTGYEQHATIDDYYAHLGAAAPVKSLVQEVEVDDTDPQEALKFGNSQHLKESEAEDTPGGPNQQAYDEILPQRKKIYHEAIEAMMNEPSGGGGPVIAVVGSVPSGPQAGLPEIAVPLGYTPTQRRSIDIDVNGGAYDELNLLGVAYVIEKLTHLHKPPAEVNPSMYRCVHITPAEPFSKGGHCNPDREAVLAMGSGKTVLPFALETASAAQLEEMLNEGALSSKELVKAELYRIALTNAEGPAVQAVRDLNPNALQEAAESDKARKHGGASSPLDGIPVLIDDSIDATGMATSAGSIMLENNMPAADATLVAKLKAAGAIVLGDTNTGELGGMFSPASMPQGYSSLGGQVLLPSDTNKTPGGSSAGSAAAVSIGLAPLAFGVESSPEASQLVAPAGNAGLVALKPTVGLVSRAGVLPVSKSQDSPGPIAQTVEDVADALGAIAGPDPADPATLGQPAPLPSYTEGLATTALLGKKIAVVSSATAPYPAAVAELETLGASTGVVTPGAGTTAPGVLPYEFHRDLDSYLSSTGKLVPKSLQQIITFDKLDPLEALKYGQEGLLAAQAVETGNPATKAAYEEDLAKGQSEDRAVIDEILAQGYSAIMVPSESPLVGIADRAGYPVLTVPAGFAEQNSKTGGDPIGVDFIDAAYGEPELLDDGYAFEQGTMARQDGPSYMLSTAFPNPMFSGVPSETNQSMFRCVPGSAFFKPYDCNPGEQESALQGD